MSRTRRMFDSTKKAEIVRRHLKDKSPSANWLHELDVQPSQIYHWIETALAQLERAFEKSGKNPNGRPKPGTVQGEKNPPAGTKAQPQKRSNRRTDGGKLKAKKLYGDP